MAWRDLILNNFRWKMTALFLAIVVWLTLHFSDKDEYQMAGNLVSVASSREFIRHPIIVMKAASDPRDFRLEPDEVDITVGGDAGILRALAGSDLRVFVDLTRVPTNKLASAKVQVDKPRGVTVQNVVPDQVRIEWTKP